MPQVGLKLTIPIFEWQKTVHTLDCMTTVIRKKRVQEIKYMQLISCVY
jgi:hypothetical protein